jgi:hypothetical protein
MHARTHTRARANIPMCMCSPTITRCSFTLYHKHYPHSATDSVLQQLIASIRPHILLLYSLTRCIRPARSVLQYAEKNVTRAVLGSTVKPASQPDLCLSIICSVATQRHATLFGNNVPRCEAGRQMKQAATAANLQTVLTACCPQRGGVCVGMTNCGCVRPQ